MLRILLVSTAARRHNLIEERPMRASIEQLRFAMSAAGMFDWLIGRWAAAVSSPDEDDRAILELLETFERIALEKHLMAR